ncbi:unnamed protein product [Lasius platythorax]|uniref:Uncharacterized protein n=1 Tax=Lasius platythorax TaxID=488582 RepID=A0AAV2MWH7_9HYME
MEDTYSSDEDELLLLALMEDEERNGNRRKTRKWIHEINMERKTKGEFYTLVPQLLKDEKRFYIYFRMTIDCFDEIVNLIKDDIRKQHTNFREPIPPQERLAIALR